MAFHTILNLDSLANVVRVDDGDAILMAQKLATQLGIGVGISSGANLVGALYVQNGLGEKSVVVTVFPDDNKKYLSTDLLHEEPEKTTILSPQVELLGYRAFKRVCVTCCDPTECLDANSLDIHLEEPLPHCPRRM